MADIVSGQDVDIISHTPGTGATNLGKAEDAPHTTGDTGVFVLAVRKDATGTSVNADGDYAPLQVNATGFLRTEVLNNAIGYERDSGSTSTDIVHLAGAHRKDTPASLVGTDGDRSLLQVDATGALRVALMDGTTNATIFDYTNSNPIAVRLTDTAGDYIAAGAGTQYTEDAAAAADPIGSALIAVRADSLAAVTDTDGDNIAARATNKGELYVKHVDSLTVASHAVTNAGTFAVQVDGNALTSLQLIDDAVYGDDAARSKTLGIGAVFDDSSPTAITENQAGYLRMSSRRALLVEGVASGTNINTNIAQMNGVTVSMGAGATGTGVQRVVQADGTGRTLLSAGGSAASSGNNTLIAAGTNKLKVYAFSLSTTSTTSVTCIFQSGAGGTELWRVVLQAPTSVSTGANLAVSPPAWLFATASATLLNLNLSGAQTVHYSLSYFDEA